MYIYIQTLPRYVLSLDKTKQNDRVSVLHLDRDLREHLFDVLGVYKRQTLSCGLSLIRNVEKSKVAHFFAGGLREYLM